MNINLKFNLDQISRPFLIRFIKKISEDDLFMHSAALAYYALLSLAPLSMGALLVWSYIPFSTSEELIHSLSSWISPQASETVRIVFEQSRAPDLRSFAGIFSVLSILIFGTSIFSQLQTSVDHIWKRPAEAVRTWFGQRVFSALLFFAILLVLFASSVFFSIFKNIAGGNSFLVPFLLWAFSWCISALAFRKLSRKGVAWRVAFKAGFFFSVFFDIGKRFFEVYVSKTAVASAYGAAGALVVFPIWIYYSSLMFLMGLELCFLWRNQK